MLGEIEPNSLFLFQIFIDPTVKYKVQELYVYIYVYCLYIFSTSGEPYRRLFHMFFLLYGQF